MTNSTEVKVPDVLFFQKKDIPIRWKTPNVVTGFAKEHPQVKADKGDFEALDAKHLIRDLGMKIRETGENQFELQGNPE